MAENTRLGSAPVPKLLLSMSAHASVALLLYSIYSLTDSLFLSWGVGAHAAGAASVAQPILLLLSAVSTTAGAGGASLVSRALGRNDTDTVAHTVANVFVLFWAAALLVTVLGLVFLDPLLHLLGAQGALFGYAKQYARIILAGAITSTGFSSLIRAQGNTRFGMYIWLVPISVNILLDYLFIFPLGMGVPGAALATVLAQLCSALMSMWFFFVRPSRPYRIRPQHFRLNGSILSQVMLIGLPSFLSQLSSGILAVIVNRFLGASGGANAITAFGFATKVQTIAMLPQTGIAQGAQPIIGYSHGQSNPARIGQTMRTGITYTFIYGLVAAGLAIALRTPLLTLFTHDTGIITLGATILVFLLADLPLHGVNPLVSTCFQATGDAKRALILPLTGICAVRIPLIAMLGQLFGLSGILWSFPPSGLIILLLSAFMGRRVIFYRGTPN